ncbi:MAG: alpha-aspartyl dipeptidase [Flavipsychrobacter sp.]|nr:alpha-aspartyl dipeptidase [Flavipsychrobacter sp.]
MQYPILLISSSAVHGYGYLECNKDAILALVNNITTPVLFVPYAAGRDEWDNYTDKVRTFFATLNIGVTGIHTIDRERITDHEVIFIGGGNTFRLLNELQQQGLMLPIREAVLSGKMRYMGSSAGTNMATRSICTTNDMPIVYPKDGFDALNLFTFQVNPHYLDPDPETSHKGETRDQRLAEFHQTNDTTVIGLREGAYINIDTDFATTHELYIGGINGAKIFMKGKAPYEAPVSERFVLE